MDAAGAANLLSLSQARPAAPVATSARPSASSRADLQSKAATHNLVLDHFFATAKRLLELGLVMDTLEDKGKAELHFFRSTDRRLTPTCPRLQAVLGSMRNEEVVFLLTKWLTRPDPKAVDAAPSDADTEMEETDGEEPPSSPPPLVRDASEARTSL